MKFQESLLTKYIVLTRTDEQKNRAKLIETFSTSRCERAKQKLIRETEVYILIRLWLHQYDKLYFNLMHIYQKPRNSGRRKVQSFIFDNKRLCATFRVFEIPAFIVSFLWFHYFKNHKNYMKSVLNIECGFYFPEDFSIR